MLAAHIATGACSPRLLLSPRLTVARSPVCALIALSQLVRIAGACAGGCSIAVGLYQLITSFGDPRDVIRSIYSIIFGLLIWVAEARWSGLLRHFKFLTHFLGLGLFYIFVGGLALGGAWYEYAEAILCLAVGSIYLLLGLLCRTMAEPGFNAPAKFGSAGYGDPTTAGQIGSDGKRQPDAVADMKKKAAHMAVDHALQHHDPNNPFA